MRTLLILAFSCRWRRTPNRRPTSRRRRSWPDIAGKAPSRTECGPTSTATNGSMPASSCATGIRCAAAARRTVEKRSISGMRRPRSVQYLYINVLGGHSRGAVTAKDGVLMFPEDKYSDGKQEQTYRSQWRRDGDDAYVVVTEQKVADGWKEAWRMRMQRPELARGLRAPASSRVTVAGTAASYPRRPADACHRHTTRRIPATRAALSASAQCRGSAAQVSGRLGYRSPESRAALPRQT